MEGAVKCQVTSQIRDFWKQATPVRAKKKWERVTRTFLHTTVEHGGGSIQVWVVFQLVEL